MTGSEGPFYRRILGEDFDRLPPAIRAMHDFEGSHVAVGRATVARGHSLLARIAACLFGFPAAGHDVPVRVAFRSTPEGETWTRTFAGRGFTSRQTLGTGADRGLIVEHFGPVRAGLDPVLDGGKLRLIVRNWSLLGLRLPLALGPGGEGWETTEAGRFCFHVEIAHPLTGLIVRYDGWLEPEGQQSSRLA